MALRLLCLLLQQIGFDPSDALRKDFVVCTKFFTLSSVKFVFAFKQSIGGVAEIVELVVEPHVAPPLRSLALQALSLLLDTRFGVDHFTTSEYLDPEIDLLLEEDAEIKQVKPNEKPSICSPFNAIGHVLSRNSTLLYCFSGQQQAEPIIAFGTTAHNCTTQDAFLGVPLVA